MAAKQETLEEKKASKSLMLAYILTGIAILAVIAYLLFWLNNEFPKTIHWHFTF